MTTIENATPVGALRQRITDLETLRDRVDVELAETRHRLRRLGYANTRAHTTVVPEGTKPADVRRWARAQGWVVGDRGRMPANVIDAYLAARHRT